MKAKQFINEQLMHEPTKDWLDIVGKYAKLSNYKMALNIGTGAGLTAYAIATNGSGDIVSVDIKKREIAEDIAKEYKFDGRIVFLHMTSEKAFTMIDPLLKFDLVIVDGSHDYCDVLEDIRNSWDLLREGGYMVCDDLNNYNGVNRAIKDFGKDFIVEKGKAIFKK